MKEICELTDGILHRCVDPQTGMIIYYAWNMPNQWTFKMQSVAPLIACEIDAHERILIPFAGDTRFPGCNKKITYIELHEGMPKPYIQGDVYDVLPMLIKKGAKFDLIISDPPYTMFQATRTYGVEKKRMQMITPIKEMYDRLLVPGGDIISFGFNSTGMGERRGYVKQMLLIINSGSGHNNVEILREEKCGDPEGDCDIYAVKESKTGQRSKKKAKQDAFW